MVHEQRTEAQYASFQFFLAYQEAKGRTLIEGDHIKKWNENICLHFVWNFHGCGKNEQPVHMRATKH